MQNHAPANRASKKDIGCVAIGRFCAVRSPNGDLLYKNVDRTCDASQDQWASGVNRYGAIGKNLLPCGFYGVLSNDSRAAWVNAYDFVVVSPDQHHPAQVASANRFVESVFRFVWGGEHALSARGFFRPGLVGKRRRNTGIWRHPF
jgi:hypothetical protein